MATYILSLAALASAAAAQTTISLIAPQFTGTPLAGSVVAVNNDVTTFAVACPEGAKMSACSEISTQTIAQGPSTWEMNYSVDGGAMTNYKNDAKCDVDFPRNTASCAVTISDSTAGNLISTVITSHLSPLTHVMIPITITAGADKLSPSPGGSSSSAASTTVASTTASTATSVTSTTTLPASTHVAIPSASSTSSPATVIRNGTVTSNVPGSTLSPTTAVVSPSGSGASGNGSTPTSSSSTSTSTGGVAGQATPSNFVFAGVLAVMGLFFTL